MSRRPIVLTTATVVALFVSVPVAHASPATEPVFCTEVSMPLVSVEATRVSCATAKRIAQTWAVSNNKSRKVSGYGCRDTGSVNPHGQRGGECNRDSRTIRFSYYRNRSQSRYCRSASNASVEVVRVQQGIGCAATRRLALRVVRSGYLRTRTHHCRWGQGGARPMQIGQHTYSAGYCVRLSDQRQVGFLGRRR